jgi:membrane protease YdiL (CAAX protease family)
MTESLKPRIGPWTALALIVAFFAAMEAVLPAARAAIEPHLSLHGPRDAVAVRATSSIVLVWLMFAAAYVLLRLRGRTLASIGFGRPARLLGWLLALLFAALYGGFTLMGMTRAGAPVATDWSFFRIATALGIGISAGICEETVFRGFIMGQARDGGAHWSIQIVLSAALFGLAHIGWGGMSGHVEMQQAIGAVGATAVLGLMMAAAYLVGGRSLTPVVVAHGIIDLIAEPWLLLYAASGGHFR